MRSLCVRSWTRLGIHTLSLAARQRIASNSGTLTNGLAKIQAARECDIALIFALSSEWKEKFLNPSMVHSTVEASDIVRRSDHRCKVDESPQDKTQKLVTALLCDKIQEQDLANIISLRVFKILGLVSRFRIAQVLLRFSPWAYCLFLTHPLQWSLYRPMISRRGWHRCVELVARMNPRLMNVLC